MNHIETFNDEQISLFFRTQHFNPQAGEGVIQLKPGLIQYREPHLNEIEGTVEYRTEKCGSEEIIHEE